MRGQPCSHAHTALSLAWTLHSFWNSSASHQPARWLPSPFPGSASANGEPVAFCSSVYGCTCPESSTEGGPASWSSALHGSPQGNPACVSRGSAWPWLIKSLEPGGNFCVCVCVLATRSCTMLKTAVITAALGLMQIRPMFYFILLFLSVLGWNSAASLCQEHAPHHFAQSWFGVRWLQVPLQRHLLVLIYFCSMGLQMIFQFFFLFFSLPKCIRAAWSL